MAKLLGKCPWCEGNMYDDHGEIKCLQCSRGLKDKAARAKYYAANKELILATLDQVGRPTTLKQFGIPGSTFVNLLIKWGRQNGTKPRLASTLDSDVMLPGLPEFSNDWPAEVQIKWLEVWAERSK